VITPSQAIAIAISLIASITDIRSRKIPNWLTFPGALAGILCWWWQTGSMAGLITGVQGWLLALAFMLGTRYLSAMLGRSGSHASVGFGDIKLMAALGACMGPNLFLCQLLVFCVVFGGFAVIRTAIAALIKKERLSQALKARVALAPFMALATIGSIIFYKPLSGLLGIY
jgi:prepilin peptidase CpaA